jgi:transglutaminase-like putative cysteine protease
VTRSRPLLLAAEAGLAAVTLSAVLGMNRLFESGGWLGPLAANALAAHVVVSFARRRGLSLPTTGGLMVAGVAVVATWASYWSTTAIGIPTGDTWSAMQLDLDRAWSLYQAVVAPAPVERGFVLASSVAIWFIAYVADWAAFRLWVPFEATLPAGTLFLFTALLGAERGRGWAVGLYAAAMLGFLLLHRMARQDGTSHWVADRNVQGHRSLLVMGATLGLVAVVTGTVLGPSVPGADSPGVIDPRSLQEGDQSRKTISPLVDIRSRLVDQTEVEVFQVQSPEASYWRLTSLERFDGTIWSSSGTYGSADGDLPEAVATNLSSETFEQAFTIKALAAIWLPSAYEPRAIDTAGLDVLYEEDSATLIVDKGVESSDGLIYKVTSASPRITPADLAGSSGPVPSAITDRFLDLPDDFNPAIRQLAQELTAGTATPYESARALQDYLRTFTYDLEVQSGHSDDVLARFLFETKRGYCEQFAGAFAAMARSIGLPARVAVGFTPGEPDPLDPTMFHVRGEHAHAWPEVFLAGAGWVSFEPTPGRGQPFAESYTGVPAAQVTSGHPGESTVTPTTTTTLASPTIPDASSGPTVRDDELGTDAGNTDTGSGNGTAPIRFVVRPLRQAAPIVGIAMLTYLILFPLALLIRRRMRRRRATTPAARIALAWTEAAEEAGLVGYHEISSDTFDERARRLATHLSDDESVAHTNVLARRLEASAYSAEGADDLDAELAEESGAALGASARAAATRTARVNRWLDPRPWLGRWRRGQLRHRRITTTVRADLEAERELVGSGDRR